MAGNAGHDLEEHLENLIAGFNQAINPAIAEQDYEELLQTIHELEKLAPKAINLLGDGERLDYAH